MLSFFNKITDVLNECNIPYMLSGSVAMSLYIVPRSTRGLDFIVHLQAEDINAFVAGFQDGFYCDKGSIRDAVDSRGLFTIMDHASGFKADFVVLKEDIFRQEEFSRRVPMDYFGKTIFVVSPEDLLISKLIWIQDFQSRIQMEDIINLASLESLDWTYINKWINILELDTFGLLEHD